MTFMCSTYKDPVFLNFAVNDTRGRADKSLARPGR